MMNAADLFHEESGCVERCVSANGECC